MHEFHEFVAHASGTSQRNITNSPFDSVHDARSGFARISVAEVCNGSAAAELPQKSMHGMQGMETGPGLTRALTAVVENGVDVINMSYGEGTTCPNAGRFMELSKVCRLYIYLLF